MGRKHKVVYKSRKKDKKQQQIYLNNLTLIKELKDNQ